MNIIEIVIRSVDDTAGGVNDASDGFGRLGQTAAAGMAVAAAAVAGVGLAVAKLTDEIFKAMDVEKATDRLAAQLGLTAQESQRYGKMAGDLYSGAYGESLDEVNEALRGVTTNIGETATSSDAAMEKATKQVLNFSDAFGEDLGPTTRAVGQMIKTGLAANAEEALDILTVGMQNGANAGEDLLDTFTEYPTQFREVGISGQMAMGLVSQAVQAGARDADTAADAIKEFAIRSKDGSKTSQEAFAALGMDATKMFKVFAEGGPPAEEAMRDVIKRIGEMPEGLKKTETATALFGTKWEDLGDAFDAMDPTTAVASLGQVEGAAQRAGDTLRDNLATRLEEFKRTMEQNVTEFITNSVLPKLKELADVAEPLFNTIREAGAKAFEWAADQPEILAAVAAVVGVVLVAAFVALGVAAWGAAAGVIAATWPVLLIAVAIAALAAGLVYAYENWDSFREAVDKARATLEENLQPVLATLQETAQSFIDSVLLPMIGYIRQNEEAFTLLGKALLIAAAVIGGVLVVALAASAAAFVFAAAAIGALVLAIGVVMSTCWRLVQVIWDVVQNIGEFVGQLIDYWEGFAAFMWNMYGRVAAALLSARNSVEQFKAKVYEMVFSAVGKIGELIGKFFELRGRILSAVGNLGSLLWNAGKDVIAGLIRGIDSKIGELRSKLAQVTKLIPFGKGPPAKDRTLLRPSGQLIMGGLIGAISDSVPNLMRTLGDVTDRIGGGIGGDLGGFGPSGGGGGGGTTIVVQGSVLSERELVKVVRDAQDRRWLTSAGGRR